MKENRSISGELSHKITAAVSILVLGGILGIIIFSGRVVTEFANRNAQSSLKSFTGEVDDVLKEVEVVSVTVNWICSDHISSPDYMRVINEKLVNNNDLVVSSTIAFVPGFYNDIKGEYFAPTTFLDVSSGISRDTVRTDYPECNWFKSALETGKGCWSEPYDPGNGEGPVVTYSTPVFLNDGTVAAVFCLDVSLPALTLRLGSEHFYDHSYAAIINKSGAFISYPDPSVLLNGTIFTYAEQAKDKQLIRIAQKMVSGESGVGQVPSKKAVAIFGPVHNGWSAAIYCPGQEIFGGTIKFQLMLLLIALFDLLLIYVVTRAIINRTLLPITELSYTAMNIGKGNFKASIPAVEGENELRQLHDALKYMLQSINDYIVQLKTTTAANERFASELAIASSIQKQMLRTDFINNGEVDLFATLRPAKEVGGDMYDFLLSDRSLYFAVGDVSGKGVPAALYMAISRSLFHYVSGLSLGSNGVVSCINNTFCSGNESNMFITLFVGRLNLDTGELVFCNAGHNPIIVISPDGKANYLHAKSNLAAGVFDQFPYEKESIIVEKGSRLVIYTDGISEAENVDKELYGESRLLEFANSQSTTLSSEEFIDNLMKSVKAFTGDNDQNDDITVLSVKI